MYLDFTFDFVFSSSLYSIGRRFRRNVIGNFNSSAWRHFILGEIFELLLTARVPVPRLSWSRSMINDPREKSGAAKVERATSRRGLFIVASACNKEREGIL